MKKMYVRFLYVALAWAMGVNLSLAQPMEQVHEKIVKVKNVELRMRFVNAGVMLLGKGDNTLDIELNDDFWVSETEVTNELWNAVMGTTYKTLQWPHPAKWVEASDFVNRLNNLTGETFRLISEAEWEYVARYGNKQMRFSGSDNLVDVWRDDYTDVKASKEGALNKPNFLGVYGMSSKGGEWCYDYYQEKYPKGKHRNYRGPERSEPNLKGTFHVIRGEGDKVHQSRGENTARSYGMEGTDYAHIRLTMPYHDVTKDLKTPPANFPKNPVNLPAGMVGNWRGTDTNTAHYLLNLNRERKLLDAVDNKIGYGYLAETDFMYEHRKYYVITKIVTDGKRTATITYEDPEGVKKPQTLKLLIGLMNTDMTGTVPTKQYFHIGFIKQ